MRRAPVQRFDPDARRLELRRAYRLHQLARDAAPDRGELEDYGRFLSGGGSLADLERRLFAAVPSRLADAVGGQLARHRTPDDLIEALVAMIEADPDTSRTPLLPIFHPDGLALDDDDAYRWWLEENDALNDVDRARIRSLADALPTRPRVSLLILGEGASANALLATLASLAAQLYTEHETLIVVPGKPGRRLERRLARPSHRRGVRILGAGGSTSTADLFNLGLRESDGQFLGLVDPGDLLSETATFEIAHEITNWPDAQLIYSDEDVLDTAGRRCRPTLKPGWDPDAVRVQNQIGRLAVFSRDLLLQLGGMRQEPGTAAEHELALRAGNAIPARCIRHVASLLYHRREAWPSRWPRLRALLSAPNGRSLRPAAAVFPTASRASAGAGADRANEPTRIVYPLPATPPLVSIVIPTRDRVDLLQSCIDGILAATAYDPVEVIIVDNDSREAETQRYIETVAQDPRVRLLGYPGAFNWAAINNRAVEAATGEVVVLLNNDVEIIDPDWLRELVSQALRQEVGLVGAKLLYPDRRVQHAGIAVGPDGATVHVWRYAAENDPGYMRFLGIVRNVSAVTGACIALRKAVFAEAGGLDEVHLAVTCSDTDLCFRVRALGYRVVWTPHARLVHAELSTRGSDEAGEKAERARREQAHLRRTWGVWLDEDPYLSPHLVRTVPSARMFARRRTPQPWRR
jgi:GT2 family glycosyltransferase